MIEPKQRNLTRPRLAALGLIGISVAVILFALFAARANRRQDMGRPLADLEPLGIASEMPSLTGRVLLHLRERSSASSIGFGPENSIYWLLPERQELRRLKRTGDRIWTVALGPVCECGYCVAMNATADGSVFVLDMRDNQICELSSEGRLARRFPLPGSQVSVTFGVVEQRVLVNSLLGESALTAYDFAGRRLEFAPSPVFETPEQRLSYVIPIQQGWVAVHRFSGTIRLLGHGGESIAAFSNDAGRLFRSERTVAYLSCSPGTATTVWCLTPSDSPDTTLLQGIHLPAGRATNLKLSGAYRSLAVSGRTALALTRRGDELWEFAAP